MGTSAWWRTRRWRIVGALAITETVSWGVLYYAFAVFLAPMERDLAASPAELTGAYSLSLLITSVAGVGVGRYLDRHGPRALMTAGSIGGVACVLAWSRVDGLLGFYVVWALAGVAMAAVLYEPAFTVLAKWFPEPGERRRAITALTLVAAVSSFVFLPLSQALIDAHGWRTALVVLAAILGVVTVPLHALVLRAAPAPAQAPGEAPPPSVPAGEALRTAPFWMLTSAFFVAMAAAVALAVQGIPFLRERGYGAGFAAFAIGVIGISQIPGRLLFAPLAARLSAPVSTATSFALVALGLVALVAVDATAAVIAGMALVGMGNGMALLARATVLADRYGPAAYGAIAGVAGAVNTGARAVAPVGAAAWAGVVGYPAMLMTLAAGAVAATVLAYAAERR